MPLSVSSDVPSWMHCTSTGRNRVERRFRWGKPDNEITSSEENFVSVKVKSVRIFSSVAVAALLLAGCQSGGENEGPGNGYGPHSGPVATGTEPIMPPPINGRISREVSSSKTKSWVSSDGTIHKKSSGTSVDMSVDPNAAVGLITDLLGSTSGGNRYAQSAAASPQSYLGKWRLSVSGRECSLTLRPGRGSGGSATVFGCLKTELSDVRRWSLRGYELVLIGMFDKQIASLRVTQPNRLDGLTEGKTQVTVWR